MPPQQRLPYRLSRLHTVLTPLVAVPLVAVPLAAVTQLAAVSPLAANPHHPRQQSFRRQAFRSSHRTWMRQSPRNISLPREGERMLPSRTDEGCAAVN
jgi:hypothetical protein